MTIRFDDQVVIITGAGNGLGKAHALAFAERGAKVVVNDLGGARDGTGGSQTTAQMVADEITANGGTAIANTADITQYDQVQAMVNQAMTAWGRIDVLVNNAGVLRDKTFAKVDLADFKFVVDVHLNGSVNCSKAVWNIMRKQNYGRIVMTTSSSGLYGNFGQTHYGAAKMAVIGLMNTLKIEGARNNIHVNALAPTAMTRMTLELLPEDIHDILDPKYVSPGVLYLASAAAPTGEILTAGAGCFAKARMVETEGVFLGASASPESLAAEWDFISHDRASEETLATGMDQSAKWIKLARA